VTRPGSRSSASSPTLRGPPKKPKQSGNALWCGNLPAQTNISELKDYFSREATQDIESVFLISKSNCAFINYKSEESCGAALTRFHDSRFRGAKLVCRLRRDCAEAARGLSTGLGTESTSSVASPSASGTQPNAGIRTSLGNLAADTGGGDKFFVMKSLTVKDLDASVQSASWATQSHNEDALKAAYEVAIPHSLKQGLKQQLITCSLPTTSILCFQRTSRASIMAMREWLLQSTKAPR
jgi:hypothetical protein